MQQQPCIIHSVIDRLPPLPKARPPQNRFLVTIEPDGSYHAKPLGKEVCVLQTTNPDSLTLLIREIIPRNLLPAILQTGIERLAQPNDRSLISLLEHDRESATTTVDHS
ncbi:MAG: hypothetical protein M0003_06350 [Acidithiobacillus sp.]|nr:hypothetical protein [Acidithiobacillus sp.]